MVELHHESITVRTVHRKDAPRLQFLLDIDRAWLGKWEVTLPWQGPNPPAPSLRSVESMIRSLLKMSRKGESFPFVIEHEGEIVGQLNVGQVYYGGSMTATIGYWIYSQSAGKGIMPVAVALVTDYLFDAVGLHRVEICVVTDNRPSQRVVEKLGYRFEGVREAFIHINGEWRDHNSYALVKEDVPEGLLRRYLKQG